jgi:hypothetical protein
MNKIKLTGIAFIFSECVVKSGPFRIGLVDWAYKSMATEHMSPHEISTPVAVFDSRWRHGSNSRHVHEFHTVGTRFYPMPAFEASKTHPARLIGCLLRMCHRISGSCIAQIVHKLKALLRICPFTNMKTA